VSALSRRLALRHGLAFVALAALPACGAIPPLPPRPDPGDEAAARDWIALSRDGRFLLHSPRQEMGQRVGEALRRLAAAELGVPPAAIALVLPRTDAMAPVRATVGSESVQLFGPPLRRAAAQLAGALRAAAAARLGVAPDALVVEAVGFAAPGGQRIGWGALAGAAAEPAPPPAGPPAEIAAILAGDPVFVADLAPPDRLFGAMLRPPRPGARLAALDGALPPGVVLVREGGQAGLVAERPGLLADALAALRPAWEGGEAWGEEELAAAMDIDRRLAAGGLSHRLLAGSPEGPWDVDLRLDIPLAAHAALEPRAAIARWSAGGTQLEVRAGTQDAFFARRVLARRFGLAEAAVTVISCRMGGGFGGRAVPLVEVEAALLARAVAPRPVLLAWSRAEELSAAYHRPPSSHRLRARLGADGMIAAWSHGFASGHVLFTAAAMPPWLQRVAGAVAADGGVARGALPPYALPPGAARIAFDTVRLPVPTGPWRGLGAAPNALAIEAAMEALAWRSGQDPLALRLRHLAAEPRLAACLRRAAAMAGWGRALPAGHALGLGCAPYKGASWAAVVAEVAADPAAPGGMRVEGLWAAQDSGRVLDPDAVRAQMEGNMVWAIGMVLAEGLALRGGEAVPIGGMPLGLPAPVALPRRMELALIEGDARPGGAGETALGPAAAAIFNAIGRLRGGHPAALPVAA
jgi:isoquinoline 1-oxidoreductase beta subunit